MIKYLLLIVVFLSSCLGNKGDKNIPDTHQRITTKISADNSELILESFIDTNKIIVKQSLIFKKNGIQVAERPSPIIDSVKYLTHYDSVMMLDNIIVEVGVLKGSKGTIFTIFGAGSCNACPELFAFYNQSGECIWLNYSNQHKLYKTLGDFSNVCKMYGIDSLEWFNKGYKKVSVPYEWGR